MRRWAHRILMAVVFLLTSLMFLSVFGQVIFRYVLKHPLQGSEELARYLMVWLGCLAASEAYRQKSHVGVSFLVDALSGAKKVWLERLVQLVVAGLMAVIAYHGFKLSWLLHDQTSPALDVPMTWPYLAVPVSALLIGCHAVVLLVKRPGGNVGA